MNEIVAEGVAYGSERSLHQSRPRDSRDFAVLDWVRDEVVVVVVVG